MNPPVPSRRHFGVLLIWVGGVAMTLAGAFTLAWLKLPQWQPEWVIEHSPWAEPAVRAMMHPQLHRYDYEGHVLTWGTAIGPVLRRFYERGSLDERVQVMVMAAATLNSSDDRQLFQPLPDGRHWSGAEEQDFREDIRWLAVTACAEGPDALRFRALPLIVALRDPDLIHLPCDWLLSFTSEIPNQDLLTAITDIKDSAVVPRLIPLLVTAESLAEREMIANTLGMCLAPSQVAEVLNAALHQNGHVREWAASAIDRVSADHALDSLLLRLLSDSESDVRLMALDTVIRSGTLNEFNLAVITRLEDQTHEIRQMALNAIITQKVPPVFCAAFIARLDDPAVDLRLMIIDAIGELRIRDGGDPLLARLTREPELSVRVSIIQALGRLNHSDAKAVLRQIIQRSADPLQGAAIVSLGTLRDPTDFPLLLTLLVNDDDDIARKARIALSYLPLTPTQQKQVDGLWEGKSGDDVLAPTPIISSPPSPASPPTP